MANKKKPISLNVETLVLVAVWENPFIFQGCIKISELYKNKDVLYFFRCQSNHREQRGDFSPQEDRGRLAVNLLLNKLDHQEQSH